MRIKARGQKRRDPGEMTLTEKRYANVLETMLARGEIVRFDFEPERLVIGPNTAYTPDYRIVLADLSIVFCEVKPRNYQKIPNQDKSAVKIKVAAEMHPYIFWRVVETGVKGVFEMEVIEPR
jgi:hypothetical protein